MTASRIALSLGAALFWVVASLVAVPLALEATLLLRAQDDPGQLADHALDRSFNAGVAAREINAALAAEDGDLAQSFLDLARDRGVAVDPELARKVEALNSASAAASRMAGSFGRGLITGEPDNLAGLAGTAVGDLFVFGDIRDAVREGSRLAAGEQADELILGLACVGLAVTTGTYVTIGAVAPVRIGVSILKAAGKTGVIGARMTVWLVRSLREVVDAAVLRRAVQSARITDPTATVRAARNAFNAEKAQGLMTVIHDVGRVQGKAGTQAALDGLKLAEGPRDVSRLARLAETKGTRTRAVLKLFGRAALLLTTSAINLFFWLISALLTLYGFCASCKRTVERATERHLARRKRRRARAEQRALTLLKAAA
jgi:hypothetical protein